MYNEMCITRFDKNHDAAVVDAFMSHRAVTVVPAYYGDSPMTVNAEYLPLIALDFLDAEAQAAGIQ